VVAVCVELRQTEVVVASMGLAVYARPSAAGYIDVTVRPKSDAIALINAR